jgi:hypothetical protein
MAAASSIRRLRPVSAGMSGWASRAKVSHLLEYRTGEQSFQSHQADREPRRELNRFAKDKAYWVGAPLVFLVFRSDVLVDSVLSLATR